MAERLSPFQTYQEYVALKAHFNSTFDYFKYAHKTSATSETFKDRADNNYFVKMAKHPEPIKLMLANFAKNTHSWIGDIISPEGVRVYEEWNRRIQSLSYTFKEEIKVLDPEFDKNFLVKKGQHPKLIKLFLSGKICLETFIIIVDVARCYSYWTKNLDPEDLIWQEVSRKYAKYKPFLNYNRDKFKQTLRDQFQKSP
jgi:T4 gene Gp59 loader of gp41 DNA helicase